MLLYNDLIGIVVAAVWHILFEQNDLELTEGDLRLVAFYAMFLFKELGDNQPCYWLKYIATAKSFEIVIKVLLGFKDDIEICELCLTILEKMLQRVGEPFLTYHSLRKG